MNEDLNIPYQALIEAGVEKKEIDESIVRFLLVNPFKLPPSVGSTSLPEMRKKLSELEAKYNALELTFKRQNLRRFKATLLNFLNKLKENQKAVGKAIDKFNLINDKTPSPIKRKTAIVVIHGIGEQNPFETLDQFGRGLFAMYCDKMGSSAIPNLEHKLLKQNNNKGDKWIDSFLRIMPAEEDVKKPQRYVDVHEYYWANLTEEKISVGEITDWLRETLKGAKQTYNKKQERNEEGSKDKHVDNRRASLSQLANMLRRIIFWYNIVKATAIIGVIIGAALQVLTNLFSPATKIVKGIWKKFENSASAMLKRYVGDVAIYTTMDVKKKHYELREKILAGARQQIEALIKSDKYDEIIIAGHSLGSAIAYDALNKLSIRISLDGEDDLRNGCAKLKGLVTFGSPLDKIYFFFKQTTGKNEFVRRQILKHLHSFKIKHNLFPREPIPVFNPVLHDLDHLPWINFYDRHDPVSNHLDFYDIPKEGNIDCNFRAHWWQVTHTWYWEHKPMYERIYDEFLD